MDALSLPARLTHAEWRRALYPVAFAAAKRNAAAGDILPHQIWRDAQITASFAATDMVLAGRTLLLPVEEVLAAAERAIETGRDASARRAA